MSNGNGNFILFPSWIGLMESNGGVHTEGVATFDDPFGDGNGNGKKEIYTVWLYAIAIALKVAEFPKLALIHGIPFSLLI